MLSRRIVNYLLLSVSYPKRLGRSSPSSGGGSSFVEDLIERSTRSASPLLQGFHAREAMTVFEARRGGASPNLSPFEFCLGSRFFASRMSRSLWPISSPKNSASFRSSSLIGHKSKGSCDL